MISWTDTSDVGTAGSSIRKHSIVGFAALALLVCGAGAWAMNTELAGAVVAPGVLVVESDVKKVQHPTGGVVGEILVRDGQRVLTGEVLVRLDETVTRANLTILIKSLNELNARKARLEAERDGVNDIIYPTELIMQSADREINSLLAGETRLFELRRLARQGQKSQLTERIGQINEEISGLTGQSASKRREIEFIRQELSGVRELWQKRLVPMNRVMSLEREGERLDGEANQLIAGAAQAKGKQTETSLQIIQIDQDLRSDVAKELREIQAKTAELLERKIAAEDQLKRIDIRAPRSGSVHQLAVHTIGGVVGASETLMIIVPEDDALNVEAKIAPSDIDQVRVGQRAVLRFSAFSQRTTPEIGGSVSHVSADVTQDQKSPATFYVARIGFSKEEIGGLGSVRLVPGMPVEAFIQADYRSVASYLVKPLHDQIMKAFRER
ncbi:HlyD family type I secretion periplasmic adaptor subunit [Rhodopseudomonas pseudopalustris]|uniref:Membrane fusion protein (MFP) family protein n=1 Tax=Rhodopseudomonas pseudopalustris TaxID=1513892 RepID=A0A1H8UIR6_9BRAD|nr:HlyD family type I secretion periplasmic adaptor subunit [Rhodopseudomonas pseudopalustris]SEP02508.1 HlyD family secretion protein [Rhodopseudomonas pseudopalustris]